MDCSTFTRFTQYSRVNHYDYEQTHNQFDETKIHNGAFTASFLILCEKADDLKRTAITDSYKSSCKQTVTAACANNSICYARIALSVKPLCRWHYRYISAPVERNYTCANMLSSQTLTAKVTW